MQATTPFDNFEAALERKSKATGDTYRAALRDFCRSLRLEHDELVTQDRLAFEDRIKSYLQSTAYGKAHKVIAALKLFCAANRVLLDFNHLSLFMPRPEEKESQYKPYTKGTIASLINAADARTACSIYCMAAGGMRRGALAGIIIDRDLTWLQAPGLYAVHVYPLAPKEHYFTFLTPQASGKVKEYIGRRLGGPLFVDEDSRTRPVTESALNFAMWQLVKTNIKDAKRDDSTGRANNQMTHGFRKFFRTALSNADILDEKAEKLIGHSPGLVRIYALPDIARYFDQSQYAKAIDELTFTL